MSSKTAGDAVLRKLRNPQHLFEGVQKADIVQAEVEREPVISVEIAYVEVRANLARAAFKENPPRLTGSRYGRAVRLFDVDWSDYFRIPANGELLRRAADLSRRHLLRAYDSVHLAAALEAAERVPDALLLSTWDRDLAAAAIDEGISLAHEVTN